MLPARQQQVQPQRQQKQQQELVPLARQKQQQQHHQSQSLSKAWPGLCDILGDNSDKKHLMKSGATSFEKLKVKTIKTLMPENKEDEFDCEYCDMKFSLFCSCNI